MSRIVVEVEQDLHGVVDDVEYDPFGLVAGQLAVLGYRKGNTLGYVLLSVMPLRLERFRAHVNRLFSTDGQLFVPHAVPAPNDGQDDDPGAGTPWMFNTRHPIATPDQPADDTDHPVEPTRSTQRYPTHVGHRQSG